MQQENSSHFGKKTLSEGLKNRLQSIAHRVKNVGYSAMGIEEKTQKKIMLYVARKARTWRVPEHELRISISELTGKTIAVQLHQSRVTWKTSKQTSLKFESYFWSNTAVRSVEDWACAISFATLGRSKFNVIFIGVSG